MRPAPSQRNVWIYGGLTGILGLMLPIGIFYFGAPIPVQAIIAIVYLSLIAFVWNRTFSRNPRFLLGLIAGPALMIGVGFVAGYGIIQTDLLSSVQAPELERMVGLKLPAKITGLHSSVDGFMDTSIHARFEMPKAEYPEFLRSNTLEPDGPGLPFADDAIGRYWWKPEALTDAKSLVMTGPQTGALEQKYVLRMIVGNLEGENVTVYLQVFGN